MSMQERVLLYALVCGLQPQRVLATGTGNGGAAMIVCAALDDLEAGTIVTVDARADVAPADLDAIRHRTTLAGTLAEVTGPFDLALLDGDPAAENVAADIAAVLPLLAGEAHLLLHDAHHAGVAAGIERSLRDHDGLTDAGLVSAGRTADEGGGDGHWGGLRLLRFTQGPP
jgi:predicted O-methyltransferase YrrM